jgi:putative transposase
MPGEGVYAVEPSRVRTIVVRLLPNGCQQRKLRKLADLSAKLYNELNYERRQQFLRKETVDLRGTWSKFYRLYRPKLGVNAQAVMQKNNEAWQSLFSLLKLKKAGRLPPHIRHVGLPGYWKDRKLGRRKLILVVRQDRYAIDVERKKLVLKDFKMEIDFAGEVRWHGKQGRLEIFYDDARGAWYAAIPVEVGSETTRKRNRARFVVRGRRRSVQIAAPKGDKRAAVDLGINILASVAVDDGTWLLYRGARAKQDFFYFTKRIAEVQSLADRMRNMGLWELYEELMLERRRLYGKLRRRLKHLYRTLASHLVRTLYELGVSALYIGYPLNIARQKGNKLVTNLWSYRKLMEAIELKAQEYGIRVYEVAEYNTSRVCATHGTEAVRATRGVVACPVGHKLHADLNGALNILKRATGVTTSTIKKPLSYIVGHNGVAPSKGAVTPETPGSPAL